MEEAIKLIGGILGIITFFWRIKDEFSSYLHIAVEVSTESKDNDKVVTALATVENKGLRRKNLEYALLLVGPELEDPVETANHIAEHLELEYRLSRVNEITWLKVDHSVYLDNGRAIIPLPFFFAEQKQIGDEKLSYKCSIETKQMQKNTTYAVRFIIEGQNLVRLTQDLLVL